MEHISWENDYNTGIEKIDTQHQQLVNIINEIYDMISIKNDYNRIMSVIDKLEKYALVHFETEEKLFDTFAYPDKENHIKEHRKFMEKIQDFKTHATPNVDVLALQVFKFTKTWLIEHILVTDEKYISLLRHSGPTSTND